MSERVEISEIAAKPDRRPGETPHAIPINSIPDGLSFLSIPGIFGSYPDTAESGETYDIEVSLSLGSTSISALNWKRVK